jgi:TP901 family phage tail tape measure protein
MSGKKNTEQYRKLEKQYNRVTKSAQKGDAQLKKLDKQVGDNFRNVGNYVGALNTLKTGLAQLGLAFGIGTLVRGGVESIIDFDQAVADLSAITGASGEDLKFFKEQARELGIEVDGGASAVVEAYKLIGSAQPELLENARALNEVTKSAILLSQASGMDLPEASKNLTDAMNQFGASSEQAGKFVDVLASGSKFGAVEIPQITEALLKFGAVSRKSNVSIQESVALIEVLGKSGVKGAEAGTKLRNVMLKLSAPETLPKKAIESMERLGINFDLISDTSKPFIERLEAMQPILSDVGAMTEVFGVQNQVVGQIILENTELFDEYTEKMDTNGVAQEQADRRTQTLGHALMELKNAFTNLFLGILDGDTSMQGFVDTLKWITANLPMIVTLIFKLVRGFVVYKTTIMALRVAQRLYNTDFKTLGVEMMKQIPLTKAYRMEQIRLAKANKTGANATKQSTLAVKGFGRAIASIGIFALITAVTELAMAWYDVASGAKEARMQEELRNNAIEFQNIMRESAEATNNARIKANNELLEQKLKLIDDELRRKKALTNTEKEQLALETESAKKRLDLAKQMKREAKTEKEITRGGSTGFMTLAERRGQLTRDYIPRLEKMVAEQSQRVNEAWAKYQDEDARFVFVSDATTEAYQNAKNTLSSYIAELTGAETELESIITEQKSYNTMVEEYTIQLSEAQKRERDGLKNKSKTSKVTKKQTTIQRKLNTEYKKTNEYLSRQIDLLQELTEIEQERQLISAQKDIDAEFERQLKLLEDTGKFETDALNEMIRKKTEMEKGFIDQRVQYEMDAIDRKIEQQEKKEMDALFDERQRLLSQDNLTQQAIDKINENFDKKDDEMVQQQLKRRKDAETEKVIIHEQGINDKKELDDEYLESIDEYNDKLVDKQKEANRVVFESTEAIVKASADYFILQSQRKIKQLEKEISMAEKQADTLRALAEQGNIDAQESLAEQQKIIAEANRKKLEEQKRQQRIQLAQSVYSTYTAKVNAGSKNALAETIRDTQVLNQFIQSLPTFFDGTEDTGTNGRGIDGKGGFLSVLHPNERVVPKSLNEQIGTMSNDELSQLAMEYQNGKIVRSDSQISSALELAVLVNRLDNLTKVIQDKPETNIELGEITQGAMEIVKSTKKGNTIVYNRYKVK